MSHKKSFHRFAASSPLSKRLKMFSKWKVSNYDVIVIINFELLWWRNLWKMWWKLLSFFSAYIFLPQTSMIWRRHKYCFSPQMSQFQHCPLLHSSTIKILYLKAKRRLFITFSGGFPPLRVCSCCIINNFYFIGFLLFIDGPRRHEEWVDRNKRPWKFMNFPILNS